MSEKISGFKPEFEHPFHVRAFSEINNLVPILKQKQREVVSDPEDIKDLDSGWSLIRFNERRLPLELPSIGSDEVELYYVTYPNNEYPLIDVGLRTYADNSPKVSDEDLHEGFNVNGYNVFLGAELKPFIVHWDDYEIQTDQPLGEQVADLKGKRFLSDDECEGIVNLVKSNINEVSDKLD
jgi:hypothetical protein